MGRRRPTHIGEDERRDILTLRGAGYTFSRIAETLNRSEATVRKVLQDSVSAFRDQPLAETRVEPTTRGEQYLQWHAQATAVAAANGDAKPAMDMLDRLGMVPETSRDRTLLAVSREKNAAQTAIANAYGARGGQHPTVNIGIGFPAQLAGVSQVSERGLMQVTLASENQRLTGAGNEVLEIPSSQVLVSKGTDAG